MVVDLHLGDCIEVMSSLPDESIDAVICDPPYGITKCRWDSVIPLDLMWEQLLRVAKPKTPIVLMANQPYTSMLISSNVENYRHEWVWVKNRATGHLNAKKSPLKIKEDILVFSKEPCLFFPQKTTGHPPVNKYKKSMRNRNSVYAADEVDFSGGGQTDRYPTNILRFNVVPFSLNNQRKYHPTQKPVDLMEYLVKTYTQEGDLVLDFSMGSGSTGEACINLNRGFVGIEKKRSFFDIAKKRLTEGENNEV